MKKQIKFLAVLSTAVLTAALSFPAYAKNAGWAQENGNWYYYDSYGEPLTDTWKVANQCQDIMVYLRKKRENMEYI